MRQGGRHWTNSRLAALGLEIHHTVAGMFLTLARLGKKPVNVMPAFGGEFVFDAPDFPQDKVAFGGFNCFLLQCFHRSFMNSSGVASAGRVWPFCSASRRSRA